MKNLYLISFFLTFHAYALDCTTISHHSLAAEVIKEIKKAPLRCNPHDVHLTFDDGPAPLVTPELLKELKKRNIKATFFITTANLERKHHHSEKNQSIVAETLKEGHLIASHGHHHDAHDLRIDGSGEVLSEGMSDAEREHEVEESIKLLNQATHGGFNKQKTKLFRFPYGRGAMPSEAELKEMMRRNKLQLNGRTYAENLSQYRQLSPALQVTAHSGFSHLGWNHDSKDSSLNGDIPPQKLKTYILDNLRSLCSSKNSMQVALFHDIKPFNKEAVPVIIDIGKCLGLNFISPEKMIKNSQPLIASGVYIPKEQTIAGPVQTLDNLIAGLLGKPPVLDCDPEEAKNKTCYSEYTKRNYKHCQGSTSICFEGKWYSAHDPVVAGCQN
ncbi:MAG: polysaccharide deacetylase family protein [Bacteriovoracia bacterium]